MDVTKVDVGKKKRGATIAAVVSIVAVLFWEVLIFIGNSQDPLPLVILLLFTIPPIVVVIGIVVALKERMKEIDGGEADEAINY